MRRCPSIRVIGVNNDSFGHRSFSVCLSSRAVNGQVGRDELHEALDRFLPVRMLCARDEGHAAVTARRDDRARARGVRFPHLDVERALPGAVLARSFSTTPPPPPQQ